MNKTKVKEVKKKEKYDKNRMELKRIADQIRRDKIARGEIVKDTYSGVKHKFAGGGMISGR